MAKRQYVRCPLCGKVSLLRNFQVHRAGGRHRLEVMQQEIFSRGRGGIQNVWSVRKLSVEEEQKLRTFLKLLLRDILEDFSKELFRVKEKERFEVRAVEEVEEKAQELFRVKEKERFEVKTVEKEEEVEVSEVREEIFEVKEKDRFKVFEKERFEVL
jgi:hypothetical protein